MANSESERATKSFERRPSAGSLSKDSYADSATPSAIGCELRASLAARRAFSVRSAVFSPQLFEAKNTAKSARFAAELPEININGKSARLKKAALFFKLAKSALRFFPYKLTAPARHAAS